MPDIFLPPFSLPCPSFYPLVSAIFKQIYPLPISSFYIAWFSTLVALPSGLPLPVLLYTHTYEL